MRRDPSPRTTPARAVRRGPRRLAGAVLGVQRGFASVGQATNALTAAQRAQAQAAYDVAKSTVDALTLRAPIAGVVQLGGTTGGSSGTSINDLLGAAAAGGGLPGGAAAGAAVGAAGSGGAPAGPGVDPAVLPGARVAAGTPVVTVVDTSELGWPLPSTRPTSCS